MPTPFREGSWVILLLDGLQQVCDGSVAQWSFIRAELPEEPDDWEAGDWFGGELGGVYDCFDDGSSSLFECKISFWPVKLPFGELRKSCDISSESLRSRE